LKIRKRVGTTDTYISGAHPCQSLACGYLDVPGVVVLVPPGVLLLPGVVLLGLSVDPLVPPALPVPLVPPLLAPGAGALLPGVVLPVPPVAPAVSGLLPGVPAVLPVVPVVLPAVPLVPPVVPAVPPEVPVVLPAVLPLVPLGLVPAVPASFFSHAPNVRVATSAASNTEYFMLVPLKKI
jgi:hypothetical protein